MVLTALQNAKGSIFKEIFGRSWILLTEEARHVITTMSFSLHPSRAAIELQ
jgi:hypothetical protein